MEKEVTALLRRAWAAVEVADLPEEIQPVAFTEAVRLLVPSEKRAGSGRRTTFETPLGGRESAADANGDDTNAAPSEAEIYDRVVEHTGADRAKLEKLVHMDDDGLRISVSGLRLGKNNADRARAVAQLMTICRGFGLGENETPIEVIRAECARLKVYDQANFSAQIGRLDGYVFAGSGQNRRLRAKPGGISAFASLVDALIAVS